MPNKFATIEGDSVKDFSECVRRGIPSAVFGVIDPFKDYLISISERRALFLVSDILSAKKHAESIAALSDKRVEIIYPKEEILTLNRAYSKESLYKRISAIYYAKTADVVIATPESLMQTFPKTVEAFTFIKDREYDRQSYLDFLVRTGYVRAETVEDKGFFSVRGDALSVFPINCAHPIRIDFFGDTVESIKSYDADTRDILSTHNSITVVSAVETVFSDEDYALFVKSAVLDAASKSGAAKDRIFTLLSDVREYAENRSAEDLAVFSSLSGNSCDFLTALGDVFVIIDEPKKTWEVLNLSYTEFKERHSTLEAAGETFSFTKNNFLSPESFREKLTSLKPVVSFSLIACSTEFFSPLKIINPNVSGVSNYRYDYKELFSDVKNWLVTGYRVILCAKNKGEKLAQDLSSNGVSLNSVRIVDCDFADGFIYHEAKTALIGSGNLFIKPVSERKIKPRKAKFFTAPEIGDYCVHEIHGIGRVLGSKRIASSEGSKDYLAVEYSGNDILYVPVEQMDILTRYLGGEKHPRLSKLGGDFERVKAAARASIRQMSFDIKRLYEERRSVKGFAYDDGGDLVSAFINAFSYEDTDDQRTATAEIIADMKEGKVMDRLVCGDVGFGKTEVAFRAVFLAVLNGKQAAMLAPTTILSEQHYATAVERFKDFGVRVGVINRFKTAKEQREIVKKTAAGEIDFLIGTHRLLSGDVKFKDLGLLVLDEEQRFGVEHKEKIKLMKKNVDTLTLTATPIPRTLHMSLSGIREISTINTPPAKRLPVQTFVVEETDALIVDAIQRELNRGGQAFILYNRVESITTFASRISLLLKNAKTVVVHGQMEERAMEKNVLSFYRGEYDVMISTTIIENGIDLPKANTLIVIDADMLGLSTLYQLKGRVGRSDRLAYAYFTYKREKILTKEAYERLDAIMRFAEMGSGIKIAMRDLEIRGAGNVLGAEQHGHMDRIGYELYSKLLKEELTGEEDTIAALDVRVNAFIPDGYIESRSAKMDAYKEIAEIRDEEQEKEVIKELTEAYGNLPEETVNLINLAVVKSLAKTFRATAINVSKEGASLVFDSFKVFGDERLIAAMGVSFVKTKILMSDKPTLFIESGKNNAETLKNLKNFLAYAVRKSEKPPL